jgi:hypothetical protein
MKPMMPAIGRLELVARIGDEVGAHALGAAQRGGVVQHDQGQRTVRPPRAAGANMRHDVQLGRTRQHDADRGLLGPTKLPSARFEQDRRWPPAARMAQRGRQVALGADRPEQARAARLVRTIRRWRSTPISGSGRPSTMAWAEAARLSIEARWRRQPAARVAGRRRQLLGGGREGQARHDRFLLARQITDEARKARQRAEIALHQEGRHEDDAGERHQRRPASAIAPHHRVCPAHDRRRQDDGIGDDVRRNGRACRPCPI